MHKPSHSIVSTLLRAGRKPRCNLGARKIIGYLLLESVLSSVWMEPKTTLAVDLGMPFFFFSPLFLTNTTIKNQKTLSDKSWIFFIWFWRLFNHQEKRTELHVVLKSSFPQNYLWNHVALSTVWIDKDRNFKLLVEKISASAQCKTCFWDYLC